MNTRRIFFWACFVIVLGLIIWGLAVALNKPPVPGGSNLGPPAAITDIDHVRGSVGAPVTLIEYSDFQCPACRSYQPLVERLIMEASTTIRFAYRHFPLDNRLPNGKIQHPNAVPAALAAEAAAIQGRFWEMHDILFTDQDEWAELPDPTTTFARYAAEIGLDMSRFTADIGSSTLRDRVQVDKDEGVRIGINSTPTFFLNGSAIENPQSYDQFKAVVDAAVAAGAD